MSKNVLLVGSPPSDLIDLLYNKDVDIFLVGDRRKLENLFSIPIYKEYLKYIDNGGSMNWMPFLKEKLSKIKIAKAKNFEKESIDFISFYYLNCTHETLYKFLEAHYDLLKEKGKTRLYLSASAPFEMLHCGLKDGGRLHYNSKTYNFYYPDEVLEHANNIGYEYVGVERMYHNIKTVGELPLNLFYKMGIKPKDLCDTIRAYIITVKK